MAGGAAGEMDQIPGADGTDEQEGNDQLAGADLSAAEMGGQDEDEKSEVGEVVGGAYGAAPAVPSDEIHRSRYISRDHLSRCIRGDILGQWT
jgi:hypothetical protein